MKLAAILIVAGVTFAGALWLMSDESANFAPKGSNSKVLPPDMADRGTDLFNDHQGNTSSEKARFNPIVSSDPNRSSSADFSNVPAFGEEGRLRRQSPTQNSVSDDSIAHSSVSTVPTVGKTPPDSVNSLLSMPLIPATSVGETPVSPPLAVPVGARLPALFLDERALPAPQRRVLDRVANEFIDAVSSDPSGQDRILWESAREAADQQYIKLYGHAAYNALHMQAAKEAVREQRANNDVTELPAGSQ